MPFEIDMIEDKDIIATDKCTVSPRVGEHIQRGKDWFIVKHVVHIVSGNEPTRVSLRLQRTDPLS